MVEVKAANPLIRAFVVLILPLTASCRSATASGAPTSPSPYILRSAGNRSQLDTPEKMCIASIVLDATVQSYGTSRWNTKSGSLPPGLSPVSLSTLGFTMYTPLRLTGTRVLLDSRATSSHEFVVVGGRVGSIIDEEGLQPLTGHRYLLLFAPGQIALSAKPDFTTLYVTDAFQIDDRGNALFPQSLVGPAGRDIPGPDKRVGVSSIGDQLTKCVRLIKPGA